MAAPLLSGRVTYNWAMTGVASDALKVLQYREALRLRRGLLQQGAWSNGNAVSAYRNFSRILSKVRLCAMSLQC